MLDILDFPNCCTMKVLSGFGGSTVAGRRTRDRQATQEQIREDLVTYQERLRVQGMAMAICTTNNEQVDANRALIAEGFAHSKWAIKGNHSETRVRLWYKRLNT